MPVLWNTSRRFFRSRCSTVSQAQAQTIPASQLLRADLLLVIVTLLAAVSWMFSKEALAEFPPLLFMGCRFLLAGLVLAIPGRRALMRLSKHEWRTSSVVGLIFGAAMSFWIMGLFYANTLGEGAFITSLSVVIVPFLSWLLFRERPARSVWIALPFALGGLALLSLRTGFNPDLGQIYFFISALLISLTFILNGRAAAKISALALSAIQLVLVGFVALALSACFETWPSSFTNSMGLWLALSVFIGTAARFLLQTYAQGLSSPSHAAVIMILEPVWTALIAVFWFSERMALAQILGCCLILTALLVNRWSAVQRLFGKKHH